MKLAMAAALIFTTAAVGSADAQEKRLKHGGHYYTSAVSGYTGKVIPYRLPTWWGLTGINYKEVSDQACLFSVVVRSLQNVSGTNVAQDELGYMGCGSVEGYGRKKTVKLGGNYFIHGLSVCTNKTRETRKRRVKGIRIWGARVGSSPISVRPTSTMASSQRPGCKIWQKKVTCGRGRIASGLDFHIGDRGVSGLALRCVDLMVDTTKYEPDVSAKTAGVNSGGKVFMTVQIANNTDRTRTLTAAAIKFSGSAPGGTCTARAIGMSSRGLNKTLRPYATATYTLSTSCSWAQVAAVRCQPRSRQCTVKSVRAVMTWLDKKQTQADFSMTVRK